MALVNAESVAAAAEALESRGESVTGDRVRVELGGGSPNDVYRLVKAWRAAKQQQPSAASAPQAVPESTALVVIDDLPELAEAIRQLQSAVETTLSTTVSGLVARERETAAGAQAAIQSAADRKVESARTDAVLQIADVRAAAASDLERAEGELLEVANKLEASETAHVDLMAAHADTKHRLDEVLNRNLALTAELAELTGRQTGLENTNNRQTARIGTLESEAEVLRKIVAGLQTAEAVAIDARQNAEAEVARLRPFETTAAALEARCEEITSAAAAAAADHKLSFEVVVRGRDARIAELQAQIASMTQAHETSMENLRVQVNAADKQADERIATADAARSKAHDDAVRASARADLLTEQLAAAQQALQATPGRA
jgi:hypothetical protein